MCDENREIRNALNQYVKKSVIPIYVGNNPENRAPQTGVNGTGTLFNFGNNYYLLTAAHVANDIQSHPNFCAIPIPHQEELYTFTNCELTFPGNDPLYPDLDFCIISLSPELVSLIRTNYTFLTEQNIQFNNISGGAFIYGYPNCLSIVNDDIDNIHAQHFSLLSNFIPPPPNQEVNQNSFIYVAYSDLYYNTNQEQVCALQNLYGISGSSIWVFCENSTDLWAPYGNIKVAGIQTHIVPRRYIKGVKWISLINYFREFDLIAYNLLINKYNDE